jgi:hypothetical protein
MNTTFSLNRLGLLLKRYFTENRQHELSFWGIAIVVFMIMHQPASVEIFFYISGFIFAARTFRIFSYTPGGMHYLLIPATHLEKLVSAILLSTFYYFIMLLVTYIIGTILGTALGNSIFDTHNAISLGLFNMDSVSKSWGNIVVNHIGFIEFMLSFALMQSVFLLGSVYFKRNAIGKTFLTLISLAFLIGIIELVIFKISFGSYHLNGQSLDFSIIPGNDVLGYFKLILKTLKYLLIPFFWVVSYYRLTEKQV